MLAGCSGAGGSVKATIPVTPGEKLAIFVGGYGATAGGFNGGGTGGSTGGSGGNGGGGGGASDVRQGGDRLANRVVVAGGGGGSIGGAGGGNCYRGGPDGCGGDGGPQSAGRLAEHERRRRRRRRRWRLFVRGAKRHAREKLAGRGACGQRADRSSHGSAQFLAPLSLHANAQAGGSGLRKRPP